jgi:hypothetical protein
MFSKPSVDFSLISNPPLGDHESNRVSRFLRPLLTSAKGTTMTTPQIVIIRASDDSNESTNIPRDENTLRGFGPQIAHGAPIAKFPSELVAENITPQPLQSKDSDVTQLVIHVPESSSNMTNGRPPSHTGQDSTHSSREALDQTFVPIAMNVAGELVEPVKATPKVKGQTMVRQIRRMLLKRPILTLLLGREVAARVEPLLEIVARGLEVPLLAPAAPAPMTTSDGPYNSTTGVGRAPLAAIIGTSTVPAGRVVPGELPGEALEETSEEVPKELSGEALEETSEEVPKELSGEALEETSEEVPKELSGEALVAVPGIQQRESLVQMPVEIPAEVPIELPVNLAAEVRREQLGEISPGGVLDVSSEVRPDKVPGGTAPERAPEGASAIAPAAT